LDGDTSSSYVAELACRVAKKLRRATFILTFDDSSYISDELRGYFSNLHIMAIWVASFRGRDTKFDQFSVKNQHTKEIIVLQKLGKILENKES
jgi:hypothetical protein